MSTNVFLSYSSADHSVAREVHGALESNGLSVFDIQNLSAGNAWVREVDDALKSVDVVVAIISNNYSSSAYTTSEWSAALAGGKRVVPVLVEHDARIPALLAPYVGVDASDPSTRANKLEMLAHQIRAISPGISESPAEDVGSMEKRLTESRTQWASVIEVLDRTLQQRTALFRLLTLILATTFLLTTVVVVIVLTVSDSLSVGAFAPALTGVLGALMGWFFKPGPPRSRSNGTTKQVVDAEPHATNEDGVRP